MLYMIISTTTLPDENIVFRSAALYTIQGQKVSDDFNHHFFHL